MPTIRNARTIMIIGVATLGFAAAQPAFASDPKAAEAAAASAAAKGELPDTQRVCIKSDVTGSRIPRKVCDTMKGWKAQGIDPFAKN